MLNTIMSVGRFGISTASGLATTKVVSEGLMKVIPAGTTTVTKVTSVVANAGMSTAAGAIVTREVNQGLLEVQNSIIVSKNAMVKNIEKAKVKRIERQKNKSKKHKKNRKEVKCIETEA